MQLDTPTLSLIGLLTALLLPALLYMLGRGDASEPGVQDWLRGAQVYGLAFLLLALRGIVPDLASIVAGNTLVIYGYALFITGLRRFFALPVTQTWAQILTVLTGIAMFYWSAVVPDLGMRVFVASIFIAYMFFMLARTVAQAKVPASELPRMLRLGFITIMGCSSVLALFRGLQVPLKDLLGLAPEIQSLLFNSSYILGIIGNVVFAALLPILVSLRRLTVLNTHQAQLEHAHRLGQLMIIEIDLRSDKGTLNDVARATLGPDLPEKFTLDFWMQTIHPDDRPRVQVRLAQLQAGEQHLPQIDYRLIHPSNGSELWVRGSSQIYFDQAGKAVRISAMFSDITQQKRAALATERAAEAAESANRAKSEFLANMSHELRTPLNGVIGMAQLLQQSQLDAEQREYADTLIDSAQSLLGIVNDVLDYSKIEAGRLSVEAVDFALAPLLQNLQIAHGAVATSRHIECRFELAADLPETVKGDSLRLRQILGNLLSNAIKFTPAGTVLMQVTRSNATPGRLRFAVRDSGIGMDAATLRQLFQPFHQADASVTRRFGGTGLGLSIVHRLVGLLGGSITVTSVVGQGSEFVVELPFAAASVNVVGERRTFGERVSGASSVPGTDTARTGYASDVANSADAAQTGGGTERRQRILVVDDNATNRQVALAMLARMGCVAEAVGDGEQALGALAASHWDAVVMDCQMPVLDGYETTARLRAGQAGTQAATLPVIAMTANAMDGDRERCLAAGMNAYVAKPVIYDDLARAINQYVPRGRPPQPLQTTQAIQPASPAQASFDGGRLLHQALDDPDLAREIAATAVIDLRTLAQELTGVAQAAHWPDAQRIAHTLKSLALQVAAPAATECFRSLEAACKASVTHAAPPAPESFSRASALAEALATELDAWRP